MESMDRQAGLLVAVLAIGLSLVIFFWPKQAKPLLDKKRKKARILDIAEITHDTKRIRLDTGGQRCILGLPVGKHIVIYAPNPASSGSSGKWNGKDDPEKVKTEIDRKYTPVTGDEVFGYVDLVIKVYRSGTTTMPDGSKVTWSDGGKVSKYLDDKKPGDYLDINGPFGVNEYLGCGAFKLPGRTITVKHVAMMAGGSGLTPMLQVVTAALLNPNDKCNFSMIYANKREIDILCKDLLETAVNNSNGRFKLTYTLDFPPAGWQGKTGFITQEMIKECLPAPSDDTLVLMCGPPPMVEFACKKNLDALGYTKASMVAF